eukprot:1783631-Pyramimonas_sp.AAC.1
MLLFVGQRLAVASTPQTAGAFSNAMIWCMHVGVEVLLQEARLIDGLSASRLHVSRPGMGGRP